jgi:hypothetical protein
MGDGRRDASLGLVHPVVVVVKIGDRKDVYR